MCDCSQPKYTFLREKMNNEENNNEHKFCLKQSLITIIFGNYFMRFFLLFFFFSGEIYKLKEYITGCHWDSKSKTKQSNWRTLL